MAQVKKLERTFEKLIDFGLTDFVWREERVKIEIGKAAIGDARGKEFAEAAGFDGAERANFFEHDAAQRILKNGGIELLADLRASAAFDEHRAQEAQSVAFEKRLTVLRIRNHRDPAGNLP